MGILAGKETRLLVQGITGRDGSFQTAQMIAYGTTVVGGTRPGKGGTLHQGVPVFNTMREAVGETGANTSIIFVPAPGAADAIMEAASAGIGLIVCITEHIPVNDMVKVSRFLKDYQGHVRLIGPNCPGLVTPGASKVGIMPSHVFKPGNVGLISRSGTLTYEAVDVLSKLGIGQSTCVGIGGDPIIGTNFVDCLKLFHEDPATELIVLIGEIGGSDEEDAAQYLAGIPGGHKPVVAFISGRSAPPGKRMGHAGAIISGSSGGPEAKIRAFQEIGVPVADDIPGIGEMVRQRLGGGTEPMKVDHVGLATADLEALAAVYVAAFDLDVGERETLPEQGVDVLWLHGGGGAALELLAPLGPESAVGRFLERRGEGMHHLALRVPDVAQALQRCRESGLELVDEAPRRGSGGTLVAFVHPRSIGGVLIELVEEGTVA